MTLTERIFQLRSMLERVEALDIESPTAEETLEDARRVLEGNR